MYTICLRRFRTNNNKTIQSFTNSRKASAPKINPQIFRRDISLKIRQTSHYSISSVSFKKSEVKNMAQRISGTEVGKRIQKELEEEVSKMKKDHNGYCPGLAIVQVGGREDSNVYIRMKIKAATEIGINAKHHKFPRDITEAQLLSELDKLNNDPLVHGIIVQMPLDADTPIDSHKVTDAVLPSKDVDGLCTINEGRIAIGDLKSGFMPCTPFGCIELIKTTGIQISGSNAVVLGRSKIVGTPAAELLKWHDATVTVCHSKTKNISELVKTADILVVGIGRPEMVKGDWVKPGAVVIDCGINAIPDETKKSGQRLVGDVDFEEVSKVAGFITPVPGGVGPMTMSTLSQVILEYNREFWTSFWSPSIWLPEGLNWTDFKNPNEVGIRFPEATDLLYPIPCSILILLIRAICETYIFKNVAHGLGVESKVRKIPPPNKVLESAYRRGKIHANFHKRLAVESGLNSEREVSLWLNRRSRLSRPTTVQKFTESAWKFMSYLMSLVVGLVVLCDKSWLWDVEECWRGFPLHEASSGVKFHYLVGSSIYGSLLLSQFRDVRRKDFWEMLIHHFATLILMAGSYSLNFHRIGTLILVIHDFADVTLEFAKTANYAKRLTLRDIAFKLFVVIWVVTRLIIFPLHVIQSVTRDAPHHLKIFPVFTFLYYLLVTLFLLHCFWTHFIIKLLIKAFRSGAAIDRDARSSTESEDSDEEEKKQK